ncbi:MAG TPA: FtsW/RodA/SpoVE family cell cycle protein, partial [Chloroflexota bacterium]|nr:FtsW/RodA/SpoVE family cell cycle protein [Chloroflexota bacterium]
STFVILSVAAALFFVAGARLWHLLLGLIIGSATIGLLIISASYRMKRVAAFLNPEDDPLGIGWHVSQSAIALGSGGLFGRGLGASRQKFYYLPNAHTDAIFPVIGEELGFIGSMVVVALFLFVAYRGYSLANRAPDSYGALIVVGITFWLVGQALINIGVVTALVPFTGIPLPFVSFGGSSLIVSMAAVGILLNISRQSSNANRAVTK